MSFFNHKLFLLTICLVIISHVVGQQEYLFSHLGTRDGLVSNDIMAVCQDKKGFIWIATLNGLQRYDGSKFLTFRHKENDTTTLPGNQVLNMLMDKKNRLWLLCDNNETGYFNTTDFTFHTVRVRAAKETVSRAEGHLYADEGGNIFLRLFSELLLIYDESANEFSASKMPFLLPAKWHPITLYQDKKDHNYWVSCDSGLVKFNVHNKTLSYRSNNKGNDPVIEQYAGLTNTSHPFLDSKGRFWIVAWPETGMSIHSFDINTKKEERWEKPIAKLQRNIYFEIDGIRELQDSTVWLTGNNIFVNFNNKTHSFQLIENNLPGEYSIHYDMVSNIFEDREKNIWVCTNKGLYRFNPSAQLFHTISLKRADKDSLYTPDVADIIQTQSGDILVSTWGSGIFSYDSSLIPKYLSYNSSSFYGGNQFTWCTHQVASGDIWCAHQGGILYILHPASKSWERIQDPVFENSTIRQVVEDKQGNLWFGMQKGLIVKWDAATDTFTRIQRLLSSVYRLYVDWQGDIWACTRANGVYRMSASNGNVVAHYTATSGLPSSRLMVVAANDIIQYNDSLYVIASGGVGILNKHTNAIHYLNINHDAFSNLVTNVAKDKQGFLWMTTQNGLFSINIQNEAVTYYNESDGLQNNNFNPGTSCTLSDGRIAFGTIHNFIVFNPSEVLQQDASAPKVEITGFAVMNKWMLMDSLAKQKSIVLPYDQNSINIAFSTLTYQTAYALLYKLENLDKDWVSAKSNEAIYNYLPPGTYTFKIRAVNANGVLSNTVTSLTITVQPPFWKTWWFYSLLLLAGVAILYWLDRERTKRKAVLQNMRSNISGNLHEEISNALQNINVLSEIARIKADKEPKQSKNYIDEIHHKSNSLIEAMDDMLWSIDPSNDTMAITINRMKEIAHTIGYQYNASVQVHYDDKVILLKPDMKRRHELMMIYKMALQLLAEKMHAQTILVEMSFIKNHVQLNMFAANVKLINSSPVQETINKLKVKASTLKSSLEVQADEKGVGVILSVKR